MVRLQDEPWKKKKKFDEFFIDIEGLDDLIRELVEELSDEERLAELAEKPLMFGFTVSFDSEGRPVVRALKNENRARKQRHPQHRFKPLFETIYLDDAVSIVAELPGSREGDVSVFVSENMVLIDAYTLHGRVSKRIRLKQPVEPSSKTITLNNGVLHINLKKKAAVKA